MNKLPILLLVAAAQSVFATAFTVPSFEAPFFTPGTVAGQNGWGFNGNSPTTGTVVAAPSGTPGFLGSQSLQLTRSTNAALDGVANGVFSWVHSQAAAGESTTGAPSNIWTTSFFYRTPDMMPTAYDFDSDPNTFGDGILGMNPAFVPDPTTGTANRYAFFGLIQTAANNYRFIVSSIDDPAGNLGTDTTIFDNVQAATWYRIDMTFTLNEGLQGAPNLDFTNDVLAVSIFDVNGVALGSGSGLGWEAPYRSGAFGGAIPAQTIQAMDFLGRRSVTGENLGYLDFFAGVNEIPEPGTIVLLGGALFALGLMRRGRR
jgi:hypothetical protein